MDLSRKANGRWEVRWREGTRKRGRTFDRKTDAQNFLAFQRRRQQLGQAAVPDDVQLRQFVETYWRLQAVPNLTQSTRDLYSRVWPFTSCPGSATTAYVSSRHSGSRASEPSWRRPRLGRRR